MRGQLAHYEASTLKKSILIGWASLSLSSVLLDFCWRTNFIYPDPADKVWIVSAIKVSSIMYVCMAPVSIICGGTRPGGLALDCFTFWIGLVCFILVAVDNYISVEYYHGRWIGVHWSGSQWMLFVSVCLTGLHCFLLSRAFVKRRKNASSEHILLERLGADSFRSSYEHEVDPSRVSKASNWSKKCMMASCSCLLIFLIALAVAISFASSYLTDTSCYGTEHAEKPSIQFVATSPSDAFSAGDFVVGWSKLQKSLTISHKKDPKRVLWSSIPKYGFIAYSRGRFAAQVHDNAFLVADSPVKNTNVQTIESISTDSNAIVMSGKLLGGSFFKGLDYNVTFVSSRPNHLDLEVQVANDFTSSSLSDPSRIFLFYESTHEERIFGFGEQFSFWDLKGGCVPVLSQEQGIGKRVNPHPIVHLTTQRPSRIQNNTSTYTFHFLGRGMEPLSWIINRFHYGAGGSWQTSYTGVPHYISSLSRSFFLRGLHAFSVFDFTKDDAVTLEVVAPRSRIEATILNSESPLHAIELYTEYSGRMAKLPEWTGQGAILGLQGGSKVVLDKLSVMQEQGTPVAALWLQDWCGQRITTFGKQLWYAYITCLWLGRLRVFITVETHKIL